MDPSAAPLRERSLSPDERARFESQAKLGGAEAAPALYYLGLDAAAEGRWKDAGERWQALQKGHPGSGWDRLAQFKTAEALEQLGDVPRAFVQYQGLLSGTAVADLPERSRAACRRLIEGMQAGPLESLAAGPWVVEEFQAPLRLRRIDLAFAQGLTDTVRAEIDDYMTRYPAGPGLDRVEEISRLIDATVPVDPLALGLIVPLGGNFAALGRQVRQGVELAVAEANRGRAEAEKFRLSVADEGSNTSQAVEAARGLIEKKQVIGLLGPLTSESALALAPFVSSRRVPLFSASAPSPALATVSPWFFRNTLGPLKEAAAMADYAVAQRRLTRVACVAPDNPYGLGVAQSFGARMQELGAAAPVLLTYAAGTRDFKQLALDLGGVDPGDAKMAETEEKRDQQAKVEEASTGLGRFLLGAAKNLSAPAGVTETPRLRLLVLDFAEDTACAELNAGRAFADRFQRTLAQLPELEILGPEQAQAWMAAQSLSPSAMGLPEISALGQALTVNFVLGGGCAATAPERRAKRPQDHHFALLAQLVDPLTGEIPAYRRFVFTKYQAPDANPDGLQALYLPGSAEDLGRLLPALTFCEMGLPMLGSDQWNRPDLQRLLPDLEGAVFTAAYWPDSPEEAVRRFEDEYSKAYAERPGLLAAQAYDAARLVLGRLRDGARDRVSLRAALSKVDNWVGVSGRTSFDGRQDAVKRPTLIQVRGGALEVLKEF